MNTHPHYLYSDIVNSIKADKTVIEAMTGLLDGTIAYATDTNEFGTYNAVSNVWTWLGTGGGGGSDNFWTSGSAGENSLRTKLLNSDAVGDYSFAVGFGNYASGSFSHAEGRETTAIGARAHSEGISTLAFGDNSHAEGANTKAYGFSSHAEGFTSIASGSNSFSQGFRNESIGASSATLGGQNNRISGNNSVILGGSGTIGIFNDTVFVPNLNIRSIQSGTSVTVLGVDLNGNVVSGTVISTPPFSGVDQIGVFGQNQGVPLGTGTVLNTVGGYIIASISGTVLQLDTPALVTGSYLLLDGRYQGSGTSAPANAEYITTASNPTLSNEVAIPGLAGSGDILGLNGEGSSREFDDSSVIYSWTGTFGASVFYDTVVPSHVYMNITGTSGGAEVLGTESWSATGAFDIRMGAIQMGNGSVTNASNSVGLVVLSQDTTAGGLVQFTMNPSTHGGSIQAFTRAAGTYTQRGVNTTITGSQPIWLRITRDGSNGLSFWYSFTGKNGSYQLIAAQSLTFTVARRGFRLVVAAVPMEVIADWVRTDV